MVCPKQIKPEENEIHGKSLLGKAAAVLAENVLLSG